MGKFLHQTRRSILKRVIPGTMIVFYLCFLATGLYCRCIENANHHNHDHEHPVAQADAETTVDHTHGDAHHHPSHEYNSIPHNACSCDEIENLALVSSSETEFAKTIFAKSLPVDALQASTLFSFQKFKFVTANSHAPPPLVSVYLKNQSFLI